MGTLKPVTSFKSQRCSTAHEQQARHWRVAEQRIMGNQRQLTRSKTMPMKQRSSVKTNNNSSTETGLSNNNTESLRAISTTSIFHFCLTNYFFWVTQSQPKSPQWRSRTFGRPVRWSNLLPFRLRFWKLAGPSRGGESFPGPAMFGAPLSFKNTEKGIPDSFFLATSNMHKFHFQPGLCPEPSWGSLRRSSDP